MTNMVFECLKGVDVTEIYSPERVCKEAARFGLKPGWSVDLLTGFDLNKKGDRARVETHQRTEKPRLVVGSPMCTMFSMLQTLSGWNPEKQRRWEQDVGHLYWALDRYEEQMKEGRLFLHEHPAGASSWRLGRVQKLRNTPGVYEVTADLCMFGLNARNAGGGVEGPARKRTRFLTNSWWIAQELNRQCDGSHKHQHLVGGRAKKAAEYTADMCRAICRGLLKEQRSKVMSLCQVGEGIRVRKGQPEQNKEQEHVEQEAELEKQAASLLNEWGAWDDVSGVSLDREKVKKAREEEVVWLNKKNVYQKITRQEAHQRGLRIIRVRWIDVNKGDQDEPNYRSRLVAMEFKSENKELEDLFAGTPPLEALKMLVSEAATVKDGSMGERCMLLADVSRAFFEADARREVCVEIPPEDRAASEGDMVGYLLKSLYGTRDAAANWQNEVAKTMKQCGFRRGKMFPSTYWNRETKVKVLVHGDDFVGVGNRPELKEFRRALGERFDLKTTMVGLGKGEAREGRVLNRIISVGENGWSYEADQRHGELIVDMLGLDGANPVGTPGEEEREDIEQEPALEVSKATRFRAIAARANYLAMDRIDMQYATKEICRGMATPTEKHWRMLKRLGRYLITKPRMVQYYEWQGVVESLTVYSDSNWAGCRATGRSTSGGVIMRGGHLIRSWSRTQKVVALSSGEAELIALVKAASEGLGVAAMGEEWGISLKTEVYVDSNAALGIVQRQGCGKLRHIRIGNLWVQDKRESGEVGFRKVSGEANPSDMCTKYLSRAKIEGYNRELGLGEEQGRAELASKVAKGVANRITGG